MIQHVCTKCIYIQIVQKQILKPWVMDCFGDRQHPYAAIAKHDPSAIPCPQDSYRLKSSLGSSSARLREGSPPMSLVLEPPQSMEKKSFTLHLQWMYYMYVYNSIHAYVYIYISILDVHVGWVNPEIPKRNV